MQVLVAGSSGFVGKRLCPALEEAGYAVRAMTRHPKTYRGAGEAVHGDVHDPESLRAALAGCDAAYYLVHSLDNADFEQRDATAARTFAHAAAEAGLRRIVYLGGLGDDAAVGSDADPADRGGRRGALPRRRARESRSSRARLRHRRAGRAGVWGHDAPSGRHRGPADAGGARAPAVTAAVVAVVVPGHRRGRADRPLAHRLDDQ